MDQEFVVFIHWSERHLKDWSFCDKLWPNHTNYNDNDWDIPGTKYNYIYHRFNYTFGGRHLIHMLRSTPTFRHEIICQLICHYPKPIHIDMNTLDKKLITHWDI